MPNEEVYGVREQKRDRIRKEIRNSPRDKDQEQPRVDEERKDSDENIPDELKAGGGPRDRQFAHLHYWRSTPGLSGPVGNADGVDVHVPRPQMDSELPQA